MLLSDLSRLVRYQMVFLNCSGTTYSQNLLSDVKVRANLVSFFLRRGAGCMQPIGRMILSSSSPNCRRFFVLKTTKTVPSPRHGFHSVVARGGTGDQSWPMSARPQGLRGFLSRLPKPVPSTNIPIGIFCLAG